MSLGMIALLRHDEELARQCYEILAPLNNFFVGDGINGFKGRLAQTAGETERALGHFESEAAFCRRAGYGPGLAWCSYYWACALAERGCPVDLSKAREIGLDGLTTARKLGMRTLEDMLAEGLKEWTNAIEGRESYPDGLTKREVEVLELIVRGLTNREIGEALFISTLTVATHIKNIYEKTGLANKAEAAVYAIGHGFAGN
jgi:DNA-binding CsgD family transcriptional regulator